MARALMQIGELAARTGLSLATIRHYDETGLLSPSGRSAGGFRLYSEADFDRLMVIRRMKPLGYSVDQMRELLVIVDGLRSRPRVPAAERAVLLAALREIVADAEQRRAKLRLQLDRADEFIAVLRHEQETGADPWDGAGDPAPEVAGERQR